MARTKRSASRRTPFTKVWKRDTLPGRVDEGPTKSARRGAASAFLGRLRRLEIVVLYLTGVTKLTDRELDNLLGAMLDLSKVYEPVPQERRGGENQGDEVPLLREGSAAGEASGEAGAAVGARGGDACPWPDPEEEA